MMLATQNVSLSLGKRRVLDDVSVALLPGKVTVILGPNGAGKTSLIRLLAGLIAPETGSVTLDSAPLTSLGQQERALQIGYLPQNGAPAWNVSARELVGLGRLPHRSRFAAPTPVDDAAIDAALAVTDAGHLGGRAVDAMSGGERARVLLARVLAGEPRWLLADEPLASLDPAHQLDILALLRAQAERSIGVVAVLHDLTQAARLADQIVLLKGGRLIAAGSPADVLTAPLLASTFGIDAEIARAADGAPLVIPVRRSG